MTRSPEQTKILIIGDAVAPTGFGRVIRSIFQPLHNNFELHQLATRYDGRPNDYPRSLLLSHHAPVLTEAVSYITLTLQFRHKKSN